MHLCISTRLQILIPPCLCVFFVYLLQEEKGRVEIFKEYARKNKESVWTPFLHLLNRDDRFIVNQVWTLYLYLEPISKLLNINGRFIVNQV